MFKGVGRWLVLKQGLIRVDEIVLIKKVSQGGNRYKHVGK